MFNFIKQATSKEFFIQRPVLCFTGTSYPFLFFSLLNRRLSDSTRGNFKSIDMSVVELESIKAQISIHFLGSTLVYWFGNIDELDTKKKKEFLSYIQTYTGPHSLCFFSEDSDRSDPITLPHTLDLKQCSTLYSYFFPSAHAEKNLLLSALFKKHTVIQLDAACLLMHYCSVMSHQHCKIFIDEWLDKILVPEKSLFNLSTYLFAKKGAEFFLLWRTIRHDYPEQFWLSYWSDQLFRALCFVKCARAQNFFLAKKIAHRLPFSFIKKDWQQYSTMELAEAHHFLYQVDFTIKNGGSDIWLDLLYQRFLK